ncbi:hypothetical protein ACTA71_006946 [Dictyostelium dimigraforme]
MLCNNKSFLVLINIILLCISSIKCELQLPYYYSFGTTGHFQVINIETNEIVNNVVLETNSTVDLIYGKTISSVSNQPIFKLFVQNPTGKSFSTINYDSGLNQFSNQSDQLVILQEILFIYTSPYNYIEDQELFIISAHMNNNPLSDFSFIEWDFKNTKIEFLKCQENFQYMTLPMTTYDNFSKQLYTVFTDVYNQLRIQINKNYTLGGNDFQVYTFSNSSSLSNVDELIVTPNGDIIGIGFEGPELFICIFDFNALTCSNVFTTSIISFTNNFSIYYKTQDSTYLVILIGDGDNCDTIEYNYLNLITFKVDYTFKTDNFFKSPQYPPNIYF